jgi:hypothetical protein
MTAEVENYLEHFGVKGMKWGRRKGGDSSGSSSSSSGSSAQPTRKEARAKIKSERKAVQEAFKKQWDDDVLNARNRLGKEGEKLSEARKQYKIDKKVIGKSAAKKVLKEHKDTFTTTFNTATLQTHKEAQQQMIATVGLMTLAAVGAGASSAYRSSW